MEAQRDEQTHSHLKNRMILPLGGEGFLILGCYIKS